MTPSLTAVEVFVGAALPTAFIDVTTKAIIMGATAARDWQPLHHDHKWAVERGGLPAIIANNYTQCGWISRYITDQCGPAFKICRIRFRMRKPICPGDRVECAATAVAQEPRDATSAWIQFEASLSVRGECVTTSSLIVAAPLHSNSPSVWRVAIKAPPLQQLVSP